MFPSVDNRSSGNCYWNPQKIQVFGWEKKSFFLTCWISVFQIVRSVNSLHGNSFEQFERISAQALKEMELSFIMLAISLLIIENQANVTIAIAYSSEMFTISL